MAAARKNKRIPRPAGSNDWGDLVCPRCETNIIPPRDDDGHLMEVVEGECNCPRCEQKLIVSAKLAETVNKRTFGFVNSTNGALDELLEALVENE